MVHFVRPSAGTEIYNLLNPRRGECNVRELSRRPSLGMSELETPNPITGTLSERERRDAVRGQLRPLANRRPELYDEDEYTSADYERMMELYQGSMASIDEG